MYTFHVVGLPHTQMNGQYNCCAYTGKVMRFCKMMMDQGNIVHLYGAGENTAPCTSYTQCYPPRWHPRNYLDVEFDPAAEHWQTMNRNTIEAIRINRSPKDFLCLIAGRCQKEIADAFPDMLAVEFGVGYGGIFAPFRVFESVAWQHMVYGAMSRADPGNVDGNFFDAVIPNYYDIAAFPYRKVKKSYYMYMGRLTDRKGWRIAQEVCQKINADLIVAGPGEFSGYGEYVGVLSDKDKARYLGQARAVFCPSLYIEPFCGVMAEAMLCGTPVISTPWGTFSENIDQGVNGYRCHSMRDFLSAAKSVRWLDPMKIRREAVRKWGMPKVAIQYQRYFDHLYTLWGDGWYQL